MVVSSRRDGRRAEVCARVPPPPSALIPPHRRGGTADADADGHHPSSDWLASFYTLGVALALPRPARLSSLRREACSRRRPHYHPSSARVARLCQSRRPARALENWCGAVDRWEGSRGFSSALQALSGWPQQPTPESSAPIPHARMHTQLAAEAHCLCRRRLRSLCPARP